MSLLDVASIKCDNCVCDTRTAVSDRIHAGPEGIIPALDSIGGIAQSRTNVSRRLDMRKTHGLTLEYLSYDVLVFLVNSRLQRTQIT